MTLEEAQKQVEQLQAKLHCMCGDSIGHSCWDGHSPVSMYDYALDQAEERANRLQAAVTKMAIGVNHIATYRTERWPDYGIDMHQSALTLLGAGQEYDMWCCWNAAMCARDELEAGRS